MWKSMTGVLGTLPLWLMLSVSVGVVGPVSGQAPESPVPQPVGDAPAEGAPTREAEPAPVLKPTPEGAAALGRAKAVAAGAKGLKGAARDAVLKEAVQAYREVVAGCAEDPAAQARAHYALGELQRRLKALAEAASHYQQAAEIDVGRYAGRGWYGVGQMQRRLKDYPKAIIAYGKAAVADAGTNRANSARIWVGRCHISTGDRKAGVAALRVALESAATPSQVLEAANWLAKELIHDGDLDGAEQALVAADRAVASAAGGPKEQARLQKKLAGMSARRALQRAKDAAGDAVGDAQQVEEHRPAGQPQGGRPR